MEVPWYGWLNLIGLAGLWALYWLNHKLEGTGAALRWANYAMLAVAAYFVVSGVAGSATVERVAGAYLLAPVVRRQWR